MVGDGSPRPGGDGRPRSSDSLRELVVGAGVEILERDGLQLRPESISYAKVFAYLEQEYSVRVTRGSVHERIWDSHDEFRRDVLAQTLMHLPLDPDARLEQAISSTMRKIAHECLSNERPTEAYSQRLGRMLWEAVTGSETFAAIQSLKAIASRFNDPLTAEVLHEELDQRDKAGAATRPLVTAAGLSVLRRQGRPDFGHTLLEAARILYLLNDTMYVGGHLNSRAGCPDLSNRTNFRLAGSNPDEPWTLASVAFLAFLELFTVGGAPEGPESAEAFSGLGAMEPFQLENVSDHTGKSGQRRSRDELRRLVLAAGQELLIRDGLTLQPDALRYSSVLAHIKERHGVIVNRASIHGRIWATHNQFCLEVLAASVSNAPVATVETTPSRPADSEDPDVASADRLRQWLLFQVEALTNEPAFRQRLLIKAALVDSTESPGMYELREAIQRSDAERIAHNLELLRHAARGRGYVVRPDIGLTFDEATDAMVAVTQSVVTGAIFNRLCGIDSGVRRFALRRLDGSGEYDEWNLGGVAAWACFELFFVLDPDRS